MDLVGTSSYLIIGGTSLAPSLAEFPPRRHSGRGHSCGVFVVCAQVYASAQGAAGARSVPSFCSSSSRSSLERYLTYDSNYRIRLRPCKSTLPLPIFSTLRTHRSRSRPSGSFSNLVNLSPRLPPHLRSLMTLSCALSSSSRSRMPILRCRRRLCSSSEIVPSRQCCAALSLRCDALLLCSALVTLPLCRSTDRSEGAPRGPEGVAQQERRRRRGHHICPHQSLHQLRCDAVASSHRAAEATLLILTSVV